MPQSICFAAYSPEEIVERVNGSSEFHPTIGIIFSSVALGIPEIVAAVSPLDIPIVGCSTAGEILMTPDESSDLEQSAACWFADLDPSQSAVALFERNGDSALELGNRIGSWGMNTFKDPAFIVGISGLKNDAETVVRGIKAICPKNTPIVGGLAGDDGNFTETYVFSDRGYSTDGAVAVVFDRSKVRVDGTTCSGWVGVGMDMVVTSSEGNVVYTINDRPATDIYKDYLNLNGEALQKLGVTFPLLARRPDGTEVIRTFLSVDTGRGSLTFAGSLPQGAKVRFSSSFGYEIIEKSIREMEDFHAEHPRADLVLLFSCYARRIAAGSMLADETQAASALWNVPVIGLFTYGEIGNNRMGECDFYNETLCIALIDFNDDLT